MKSKTSFYSGILGGGIIIAIFLVALFSLNLFNYRIQIIKININTAQISDKIDKPDIDSVSQQQLSLKKQLIVELKRDKSILTPQEYTNNIVNYYNTILLILSVMLAAFSALSFVYIKSHSRDLIQDKLQSNEFQEEVGSKLLGKAESRFRENITELEDRIFQLENIEAKVSEQQFVSEEEDDNKEIE